MATLALLDGHSLAYRAFYALPADLATPAGQVTNAVFGFTSMLIKLLGDERPEAVAVTWDVRGPQFRRDLFPEYKAQREAPPDLFRSQLPLIREVLEALDITQIEAPGFEADDVISTLVGKATSEGWKVIVVTGDRDSFQLIDDDTTVMYTRRGISDTVMADEAWIRERYGIAPTQYLDYAALRGDSSDNLPGVPGVGEKTATKLIAEHGDLEGVYGHLDEQTPRMKANLAENRDQAFLNRQIMTMVDVPEVAATDLTALQLGEWDHDRVRKVFDALAFRTLWERLVELGGQGAVETAEIEVEVSTAHTADDLVPLARGGLVAVSAVHDGADVIGLAAAAVDEARFVPVDRFAIVAEALDRTGARLAGHDVKPLLRDFLASDLEAPPVGFDTALAAYVVNPGQRAPDLEELAYRELGLAVVPQPVDVAELPQGSFDFDAPPVEGRPDTAFAASEAAARRATAVAALIAPLREQIEVRGGGDLYEEIELPLIGVLARMEETGIAVDRAVLTRLGDDLRRRLTELETAIHSSAGEAFNINSTLQLRAVLFDRLELPVLKKTAKGVPSTDASVLEKLRQAHPVVDHLLLYRELEKLRSTYVDALLPLIEADGRVRGRFNQMAAATGRLSQEQPNLQNIPVRSEEGRVIRTAFVAAEGHRLVTADYSQIELRILAHLSGRSRAGGGVPTRHGHPPGHGRPGGGQAGGRRDRHRTASRQGDQLRLAVRDGGIRAGATPRHLPAGGRGPCRRLLRPVPRRPRLHAGDRRPGPHHRVHHDPPRAAPLPPRAGQLQLPPAPDGGADGAQRANPGIGGGHHQEGDGRARGGARRRGRGCVDAAPDPRRAGARGPGRHGRRGDRGHPCRDGGHRLARRAPGGGHRHRREPRRVQGGLTHRADPTDHRTW